MNIERSMLREVTRSITRILMLFNQGRTHVAVVELGLLRDRIESWTGPGPTSEGGRQ